MNKTAANTIRTAARIRSEFIDYFKERGHAFVPSSPVVPLGDPTLLFTNAGMNQFKDVFLGRGTRPYRRAVNSQKCIRAGGKHNDLEDVGKDLYHHTFFEMLGNWSFGDYFKAEAIEWAWDLLTRVWGLAPDRLYATVFGGDAEQGLEADVEAEKIWTRCVDPSRVSRWGRKDNFWEMGDTGPCGPCSELHYDGRSDAERARTPGAELVNRSHPEVIEIWNLVFIQFNRDDQGALARLPARHVDTGMGFERITRVIQGRQSNYDTDIWTPIFKAIQHHSGAPPYRGTLPDPVDIAYRVIADHIRCLTMAINDGGRPSNEKAGYVLRRILRRAVRHAHQTLRVPGPMLHRLVPSVVDALGDAFPELRRAPDHVAEIIRDEEESFLHTLDRGLALFDQAATRAGSGGTIGATDAFRLHDTYGFPIDLTRVMAEERGQRVDEPGFEALMEEARERSRRSGQSEERVTLPATALESLRALGIRPTADVDKFHGRAITARVEAIWNGRDFDNDARLGRRVAVVLNRTNHYAEAGGQVGDRGTIEFLGRDSGTIPVRGHGLREDRPGARFVVQETLAVGGYVLHVGHVVDGEVRVGDEVSVQVDADVRRPTMANHTGTHLLNLALRDVVGEEEQQKGSLVAPDRLRFDFSSQHALGEEAVARIEAMVAAAIARDLPVYADVVDLETARSITGVRAVFGEQYPDPVRVVSVGVPIKDLVRRPDDPRWRGHSIEFCGGTHVPSTAEVQSFVVVQEQALAAGVRRIIALTGVAAIAAAEAGRQLLDRAERAAQLHDGALVAEFDQVSRLADELTLPLVTRHRIAALVEGLRERVKALRKQAAASARDQVLEQARQIASRTHGSFLIERLDGADRHLLLSAMDAIRARHGETAIMLLAADPVEGRVAIVAGVPKPLIARGLRAGDWVKAAAAACDGTGGGRPDMAQAGGKDIRRIEDAVHAARGHASGVLS
jgi:alanyl-tRNA synthetase